MINRITRTPSPLELAGKLNETVGGTNAASDAAAQVQGALDAHGGDFENPHRVTAAQAGARPASWTPTAQEVGARPSDWTPAAGEIPIAAVAGMAAANVQQAIEENFRSVVDGKALVETAITGKGGTVSKTGETATFAQLQQGVANIPWDGEEMRKLIEHTTAMTELPPGITKISYSAFYDCGNLAISSLPDSVVEIQDNSFWHCSNITLSALPESVTAVGIGSFRKCLGLKTMSIGANIQTMRTTSFAECTNITRITVNRAPNAVANAPWGASNATVVWTGTT
ncbi:leucine-rich repeat domain-containing protein [Anaerotruncus sp. AF02-27]|uniref:leucine-rich repeat domain-containing protein n=1 Tax=Anaerotruncus TaxID=244127 RepID=UPI000E4C11D3|nr:MULTISPECIES: leucine-rich repeat domain-containing protein [Anaerotruncus]RGX56170.1 leucine-rich repeat domain-containing protein [Anaerotruncus sp. AF02-27]